MKGLCSLKKERKEKVHSFTQRFATYLKNFSETDKPSDKVLIEYYTSALGPDLAMFAKMKSKPTLAETYEEAKMMQKLSNRIIDLEKEKEAQNSYKPYYKRREDNNHSKNPPHSPSSMNLRR